MRRSTLLMAASIVAVCLPTFLLVAERLVREREHDRETPGSLAQALYQHRRLGVALVRDLDYFGWFRTDANGFRGGPVSVAKVPGTLRIMAVGGSTTFDASVAGDENAWPARLEYWLGKSMPETKIEVVNAGVPSYRVLDNLIRLQTELYEFSPDIIILYQTHNDLSTALWQAIHPDSVYEQRPDEIAASGRAARWLARHSLLYVKLRGRWLTLTAGARAGNGHVDDDIIRRGVDRGAGQFERDLRSFLAVAREMGICVIMPEVHHVSGVGAQSETQPDLIRSWNRTYPAAAPNEVLRGYDRYRQVMRAVGSRAGVAVVSGEHFGLRGTRYYAANDAMHFSAEGADRMGRLLAESLVDLGLPSVAGWCSARQ